MQYFTIIPFSIFFRFFATVIHVFHFVSFLIPQCIFFQIVFFSFHIILFLHPHSAVCLIISYSYCSIWDIIVLKRLCQFNIDLSKLKPSFMCSSVRLKIVTVSSYILAFCYQFSWFFWWFFFFFVIDLQFYHIQFMLNQISSLLYPRERMCSSFIARHKWSFLLFSR